MKFSIVTSFYNEPLDLIEECYNSVISQTYSNFEWIITDDWSSDQNTTNTVKSLPQRDPRIKYVEQKHKKEVWWNPQTYTNGDVVVTLDGDDTMFLKTLEVYNYFYTKYPDVICMSTEIHNYKNKRYSGSLYLDHHNYKSHLDYCFGNKNDPNVSHYTNEMFMHGYNRSWINVSIDFRGNLNPKLIIVDYLQFAKLEEFGKYLHIPRALYGYNTRDVSISRKIDEFNDHHLRTQEINESLAKSREGKNINSIKRIFDLIFIESNAFIDNKLNFESTSRRISYITPGIKTLLVKEQLSELFFDHSLYFNEYRDDIDYFIIQFESPDQYDAIYNIYDKIKKYIGNKDVTIQITYRNVFDIENHNLFKKLLDFFNGKHQISWFDFDNKYLTIKLY